MNMLLLVTLYAMQGVPLGLTMGSMWVSARYCLYHMYETYILLL